MKSGEILSQAALEQRYSIPIGDDATILVAHDWTWHRIDRPGHVQDGSWVIAHLTEATLDYADELRDELRRGRRPATEMQVRVLPPP